MKYSLIPTSGVNSALPSPLTATYLSDAMEKRLTERKQAATFDFAVQFRKGDMPLHDAAPRWDETVSPFVKVATLTIPAQTFRTDERNRLAEVLSFSPGHARVEHRAAGQHQPRPHARLSGQLGLPPPAQRHPPAGVSTWSAGESPDREIPAFGRWQQLVLFRCRLLVV